MVPKSESSWRRERRRTCPNLTRRRSQRHEGATLTHLVVEARTMVVQAASLPSPQRTEALFRRKFEFGQERHA